MPEDQRDRVRQLCLGLPEAVEQEAWGEPTFRIRKKIFAMFSSGSNHHGRGRDSVWCKAPLGVQEMLIRSDPNRFFSPPYVGVNGWVGIYLDAVADEELWEHVVQSYCMIAPKRLHSLIAKAPPPA